MLVFELSQNMIKYYKNRFSSSATVWERVFVFVCKGMFSKFSYSIMELVRNNESVPTEYQGL